MTAEQWNASHPIGTEVTYHHILPAEDAGLRTRTRSQAWPLGHGEPVVKVEGITGGVLLSHLVIAEQEDAAA